MSHPSQRWSNICGLARKRSYPSKKTAKAANRAYGGGMSAYPCQPDPCADPHWHIGHLPKPVISGDISRADIDPPNQQRRTA